MRAERHAARDRGQGLMTIALLVVVVGGGFALDRGLGPYTPPPPAVAATSSGAWLCPHGGGPEAWKATLYLANPGAGDVTARITSMSARRPAAPFDVDVPAQTTIAVEVPAVGREASALVEYFGGWIAAGWVTQGGGGEIGVGAEPCAPDAGRTWFSPDGTTEKGEDAYILVMNPFAEDAVFDVVLLTPKRAPIRSSELSDVVLHPGKSVAFRANAFAEGEPAVGAEVDVALGRVAVSSLGISREAGIRSVIGQTDVAPQAFLPAGAGSGQSTLVLMVPGERQVSFGATLLSADPSAPAGGLTEAAQNPTSARPYPVTTSGASSIDVVSQGSVPFAAIQRAIGVGNDDAATGGAAQAGSDWVVLPAIAGEPAHPSLMIVNPGNTTVTVTLHALAPEGATPPADITLVVPAGSVRVAPRDFLDEDHRSAIEVRSDGGDVIAMAASTSLGNEGLSTYALSMGVAVVEG
jgi:Family of unknown function (DUF5719)